MLVFGNDMFLSKMTSSMFLNVMSLFGNVIRCGNSMFLFENDILLLKRDVCVLSGAGTAFVRR